MGSLDVLAYSKRGPANVHVKFLFGTDRRSEGILGNGGNGGICSKKRHPLGFDGRQPTGWTPKLVGFLSVPQTRLKHVNVAQAKTYLNMRPVSRKEVPVKRMSSLRALDTWSRCNQVVNQIKPPQESFNLREAETTEVRRPKSIQKKSTAERRSKENPKGRQPKSPIHLRHPTPVTCILPAASQISAKRSP